MDYVILLVLATWTVKWTQALSLTDLDMEFSNLLDMYYSKQSVIPVQTVGDIMDITVDFDLVSIIEFNDDAGYLTLSGYLTTVWTEQRYTTIADDINVGVRASDIWTPPLVITNSATRIDVIGSSDDVMKFNLKTGKVVRMSWLYTTVPCESNKQFPFDVHICVIQISALNHENTEITLTAAGKEEHTEDHTANDAWKLRETFAQSFSLGSKSLVEFKLTIKRKPAFLVMVLVIPTIVVTTIHLFVFLLPRDCQQGPTYSVVSVLLVNVTFIWIATLIPSNASPVSAVMYYMFSELILNTSVVFVSVVFGNSLTGRCSWLGTLVPKRTKPEVTDVNIHTSNGQVDTIRDIRESKTTTAWDDDDTEPPISAVIQSEASNPADSGGLGDKNCMRASITIFCFYTVLHVCLTAAFFLALGFS